MSMYISKAVSWLSCEHCHHQRYMYTCPQYANKHWPHVTETYERCPRTHHLQKHFIKTQLLL